MAGFAPPEKKPVGVPARAPAFRVGPHATPSARAMEPEAKTQPRSDAVRVSSPSDPAEREADAIAQRLVSAGAAPAQPGLPPVPPPPRQAPGGGRLLSVAPDFVTRLDAARKAGGQPLPADLRTDFHRRLGGAALDDVRLHTGARASSLAASARARAFTVERDIFFRDGNYQPDSGGGRRLIAHEVAHALQPAAAAPVISRAPDDAQGATATPTPQSDARRQQRNDADELAALLLNLLNAPALVPRSETDLLLASAESIQRRFEQSDLPRTQFVAARALVVLVQELSQREAAAPRGPEGELLRPDSFGRGMVPWTKDKPRALIAIPPFSTENIAAWHAMAFAVETPERVAPGKGPKDAAILAPTRVKARSPRSGVGGGGRGAGGSKPGDVIDVSSLLKVIRADKNEAPTGSPEIRAGVDKLRQFTVKQLVEGVAAPQAGPDAPVAHANMPEHADASVFASTDLLIYVSASRVFLLDRGGRAIETGGLAADLGLEPSKSNFRLKGFSFEPGGVYFVSKVDLSSRKGHGGDESVVTVRVDQGGRIDQGDIFLRQTNEGLLRVLPIEQEVIRSGAGIGVIVSPHLGEQVSNSAGNLMRALERVPGHLVFALGQQLKAMVEDPGSVGMQVLMGEAMGRLQSVMGRLSQLQMAFSALIDVGGSSTS